METLSAEVARRIAVGNPPSTIRNIRARLRAIGYELTPGSHADCMARYMTGEYAGESYPVRTYAVRESDTKKSAFHYQARRDKNFEVLQGLRLGSAYAVNRGRIVEF